jgi:polyhydroxyalkanoate synthesis regulator phasin
MMEERRKILEMVKDGLISVEEAERLLDAVETENDPELSEKAKEKIIAAKTKIDKAIQKIDESLDMIGERTGAMVKKSLQGFAEKLNRMFEDENDE